MRSIDENITDHDIMKMVKAVDADSDGSIDFAEFLSMMAGIEGYDSEKGLIEEFGIFDKNGDGLISVMELKYVMAKLGMSFYQYNIFLFNIIMSFKQGRDLPMTR